MDWLYRFTGNDEYPEPLGEIAYLAALSQGEQRPYLLLIDRKDRIPMSRAQAGHTVGLCTSDSNRLILHAIATVSDKPKRHNTTPSSVVRIYGKKQDRMFCPLLSVKMVEASPLNSDILSVAKQTNFLTGEATVKVLNTNQPGPVSLPENDMIEPLNGLCVDCPIPQNLNAIAVGLDPTAATWDSSMTAGPIKDMPSFAIKISDGQFSVADNPVGEHVTNEDFWNHVIAHNAQMVCIDGPCDTNGPELLPNVADGWNPNAPPGTRDGEIALANCGVGLFWTTQNTVMNFRGVDRWIARSLVLFSEYPDIDKIETHPHGAFTFLWRLAGRIGAPPNKDTDIGKHDRIALLKAFIPNLQVDTLRDDDDVIDAAVAALVAALKLCGLAIPFGTTDGGGQIWMPDCERLRL
jgi:hypothetical protein